MKKIILSIAIILGATSMYAQTNAMPTAKQDPYVANATYETNKLKDLNLSTAQYDAIHKLNVENAKTMFASSSPASADKVTLDKIRVRKETEYKKILTKEQYAKWVASPNK